MIYPQKLNSKKSAKLLYSFIITSIVLMISIIVINRIMTPSVHWAAFVNLGIIYAWVTVMYSIKRGTNIAGHVLVQTIAISLILLYIDNKLGNMGWSISIGIPILLIIANIVMLILTIVSYKKYIKYAIYQLILVLISLMPMILIIEGILKENTLNKIVIVISILNLLITLTLSYKDVREAVIRKFHM